MANPNMLNASSILGSTTYLVPTNTTATTWTGLTPSAGTVNKIDTLTATNVTSSAAAITVSINSAAAGAGTNYRLVYQINVPGNSSLIIVDKSTMIYVGESQSIVVQSGTTNAIEMVATYEAIT